MPGRRRHTAAMTRLLPVLLSLLLASGGEAAGAAATRAAAAPSGMAGRLIAHFKMQRIPEEGAWFAVTYTSGDELAGAALPPRYAGHAHAAGGAIVAVITARDFSAMHRLQTDEVWHFYGGAPLKLLLLYPDGKGRTVTLGTHVLRGEVAQFTVPKGVWQGAAPVSGAPGQLCLRRYADGAGLRCHGFRDRLPG